MSETTDILIIEGDEQRRLDPGLPDGGLPPAVGVHSVQVFRASRDAPELSDGQGWTYHHHVDMACWRGRLYVGWNRCEKDEDVWPSRELYSMSEDGITWTPPRELFPQGVSTCLRMYFYHAPNGRMLAIAGLRLDQRDTSEDRKGGLVVREIAPSHELGPVMTLQQPVGNVHCPPMYTQSDDGGFIAACEQLLADHVFLEQQDRGRLLGDRRMKWHDGSAWPGGKVPGDSDKWVCGKAWTFFRRRDGKRVGISKMGWTTISTDDHDWSQPYVPPTLVTGKAKVWAQQTADGRYALVYNPSRRQRYPLAVVTSDDGVTFRDMRIVQGELPIQRYEGRDRSIGPQYTRGISEWANDGSRDELVMWLVYSMSKEDIWVSRVPLPVQADGAGEVVDEPNEGQIGRIVPGWNVYQPKWTAVSVESRDGGSPVLRLTDRDPYDYACAQRVFGASAVVQARFELMAQPAGADSCLEIELLPPDGRAALCLRIRGDQMVFAECSHGGAAVGRVAPERWVRITISADCASGRWSATLNDQPIVSAAPLAGHPAALHRILFRTGRRRGIGGKQPVPAGTDRPVSESSYAIRCLNVRLG